MRRHGLWLAYQSQSLSEVVVWNKQHPHQLMHVAWSDSQWQRLSSWAMPTFYVFKQGKLIDQWSGWPADTGVAILRQHLQANGVLEPIKEIVAPGGVPPV